jgi:hypothetical protein
VAAELGLEACTGERAGAALTERTAAREEGEVTAVALTECVGERAAAALTVMGAISGASVVQGGTCREKDQ